MKAEKGEKKLNGYIMSLYKDENYNSKVYIETKKGKSFASSLAKIVASRKIHRYFLNVSSPKSHQESRDVETKQVYDLKFVLAQNRSKVSKPRGYRTLFCKEQ